MPQTPHRIEWTTAATLEELNEQLAKLCADLEENFRELESDKADEPTDDGILKSQVFS